jgi:subtilisin-like proprotein convertase family protein
MQAMARWLGGAKKVALLLLAAGLAAVAALGLASAASAATFSNNNGITINSAAAVGCGENGIAKANPYPSSIAVSGLASSISDVNVTVSGLSHTFPDDVGVLLVGPEGQKTILMTDVGGNGANPASRVNLTFDDVASSALPDEGQLVSGTYQPTRGTLFSANCSAPSSFPAPAPEGPYGTSLSVFNGTNPNGTWQLYVIDDTPFDAGSITGWSLDISTTTADTTPPTVTNKSPDGTVSVSRTATVTATFSEPVQNVSPETFFLERQIAVKKSPPKYVLVDATVSLNEADGSYVLNPVQDLPKGEYRATITTDVTDMADPANALDQDSAQAGNQPKVWTFTVAKLP